MLSGTPMAALSVQACSSPLVEPLLSHKNVVADVEFDRVSPASSRSIVWRQVVIISLSGLLTGYDLCVISSVLTPVQRELQLCPECAGDWSDAALARCTCAAKQLAVSSCHVGAMVGSLAGGLLADRLGRRVTLMLTDVLFLVGALAMSVAGSSHAGALIFFVGRAIGGVGLGAAGMYSSHICIHVDVRKAAGVGVGVVSPHTHRKPVPFPSRRSRVHRRLPSQSLAPHPLACSLTYLLT